MFNSNITYFKFKIKLLYGAEVDCVDHTLDEKEYPQPGNFIEIKTQQELRDKNHKVE